MSEIHVESRDVGLVCRLWILVSRLLKDNRSGLGLGFEVKVLTISRP